MPAWASAKWAAKTRWDKAFYDPQFTSASPNIGPEIRLAKEFGSADVGLTSQNAQESHLMQDSGLPLEHISVTDVATNQSLHIDLGPDGDFWQYLKDDIQPHQVLA